MVKNQSQKENSNNFFVMNKQIIVNMSNVSPSSRGIVSVQVVKK